MADLKPLGSERLQGNDKIQRILEIARYNESVPSSINETSRKEFALTLANGNEYQIVKERAGYIIKQTISESETDYIAPMQDRKYYRSYSQALKRLNLMAKEINSITDNKVGTSLFSEQKKYTLKVPDSMKNPAPVDDVENIPAPPAAAPAPEPSTDSMPPAEPAPEGGMPDMGDEMPVGDEMGDEDVDEVVTFKTIQKLTGRLGQKLRLLNSKEEDKMGSKDIKYVINSILSALDLENLEENDRDDIVNKIEGTEEEMGTQDFGNDGEEMPSEEPSIEPEVAGEMGESDNGWADLGNEAAQLSGLKATTSRFGMEEEDDDTKHIGRIADSLFMENKIENVLMKYFKVDEEEKKFNNEINKERQITKKMGDKNVKNEIKRLAESPVQEFKARKFLNENSNAKFIGKTNKNNLVFEFANKQYKINTDGEVL